MIVVCMDTHTQTHEHEHVLRWCRIDWIFILLLISIENIIHVKQKLFVNCCLHVLSYVMWYIHWTWTHAYSTSSLNYLIWVCTCVEWPWHCAIVILNTVSYQLETYAGLSRHVSASSPHRLVLHISHMYSVLHSFPDNLSNHVNVL